MNDELLAKYEPVIGLEVHVQLKTDTKMFSRSGAAFGQEPNTLTDPVVLALPGSLPVVNRKAVEYGIKIALATHCTIHEMSRFARKHYFYPDLPKGYQISQYEQPLATGGRVEIWHEGRRSEIALTRIHLEEDSGKNFHREGVDESLVDYNRAGVALAEIVSEPDFRSPEQAVAYLRALRQLVRYLEICDGNMEEGSLRCDANVSIRPRGTEPLGTKTELKNLNSFKAVKLALHYEIERQVALLEEGGKVVQSTLLWDAAVGQTRVIRTKEEAHDYRYFPEPDLPPLEVPKSWIQEVASHLEELPLDRRQRFVDQYGLTDYDAAVLTDERNLAEYFEEVVRLGGDAKKGANWIQTELLRLLKEDGRSIDEQPMSPKVLTDLLARMASGELTGRNAKVVGERMYQTGHSVDEVREELGIRPPERDESVVEAVCRQVVDAHPDETARYRDGNKRLFGFFVGQVMKQDRNQDPKLVSKVLKRVLEG